MSFGQKNLAMLLLKSGCDYHPTGQVSINSNGWMGRFHIQQDAITEPALSIRHHDASLYKHMGTVGPADRNGNDSLLLVNIYM